MPIYYCICAKDKEISNSSINVDDVKALYIISPSYLEYIVCVVLVGTSTSTSTLKVKDHISIPAIHIKTNDNYSWVTPEAEGVHYIINNASLYSQKINDSIELFNSTYGAYGTNAIDYSYGCQIMEESISTLALKNEHVRDCNIQFFEEPHIYHVQVPPNNPGYNSVTLSIKNTFPHNSPLEMLKGKIEGYKWNAYDICWGLTTKEILAQWSRTGTITSNLGTCIHESIELFMNYRLVNANIDYTHEDYTHAMLLEQLPSFIQHHTQSKTKHRKNKDAYIYETFETTEWSYFIEFVKDHPDLIPYRTEWYIYHEEILIAGSIDMLYKNEDGSLSIYDWKRVKDGKLSTYSYGKYISLMDVTTAIPNNDYGQYSMQLNIYKYILESKYGLKIRDLKLVRFHVDTSSYEIIPLPNYQKYVRQMFK